MQGAMIMGSSYANPLAGAVGLGNGFAGAVAVGWVLRRGRWRWAGAVGWGFAGCWAGAVG
jgi:hypothetical protein